MAAHGRRRRVSVVSSSALALLCVLAVEGCTHTRQPERRTYVISEDAAGIGGSGGRDCDGEHVECFRQCWNSTPPLRSIRKGSGKHYEYCTEECRERYMDCVKETERPAQRSGSSTLQFSNMDKALGWLRRHKAEVALGTIVVVAGVAFVVSTGGAGALVLAPLAL
ncbi:hypothetical protein P2318_01680 [Myxococcaceae bacterium GXIMD 01537]